MFVLPVIFAAAAATSSADLFIQRIVDLGVAQQKIVTQGALPPGWAPPAPLPQDLPLLGTVSTPKAGTQIYYAPADAAAAASAYESQLQAAGYREHLGFPGASGFAAAMFRSNLTVMCKGDGGVSIQVPSHDDLRVSVNSASALGPCASQPPHFTSPVPSLIAPAETQMTGGTGGGVSYGLGDGSSMYSSATLKSPLTAKQLIAAFASQMQAAHWKALPPFSSPQGAAQRFTYDRGTQHWIGTILLFAGAQPHTYEGRLDARGTMDFGTSANVSPARPSPKLRSSQIPAALALAQRIADTYASENGQAQLYVGKLPPSLDKRIPLPAGSLVGSVSGSNQTAFYYNLTKSQYESYLSKLRASGWAVVPQLLPYASGFAGPQLGTTTAFCKTGLPAISTQVQTHTNDVRIAMNASAASSCSARQFSPFPMQRAPVPPLQAPEGVKMQPGSVGIPGGQSGASLTTTQPLSAVLAAFATQFTSKNWTSSTPVVSEALGSQSFAYTDEGGKKWQAVLTIYRSNADPHTYYAFIDATPL